MAYRGPMTFNKNLLLWNKIGRRKDEIAGYRISNVTPITDIVYRETKAFEDFETGYNAKGYKPIKVGDHWGGACNAWFKINFEIPKSFKGKQVAAFIMVGGEGCAWMNGKPFQGVDSNHEEVLLTLNAKGGEKYELVVDAAAHHWSNPRDTSPKEFKRAELATRNPEVEDYWFSLDILHQLAETLPEDSPRRAKIIYLLNKSVDAFDYTNTDEESLKASAIRANKIIQPLLSAKAHASATNVAVHGHSHIDVAWLWPYRETKRKCSRTFSSVMRMMEQYPEYIFTQSQAQLYEFTKENYPELYSEIKKAVKAGKWDVEGSMWVEADCNLCSGESLVRQILVGKNFFLDEFGIETHTLWLPDVFGYAAALPQILQKARVPYFSTIKINWSQFNTFPYNTFYWYGIDGTRVLAHFPPATDYNAFPTPKKLQQLESEFKEHDRSDWALLSFGWGDGGGGADRRHFEMLRRQKDLEGVPKTQMMKVGEFFEKIDKPIDYPSWVGELYLELHRGTYTSQAKNKRYNRKAELLYRDAEFMCSTAMGFGFDYPYDDFLKNWKDILLNQFHDVIPGSSIHSVYEDTDEMYPKIIAFGQKALGSARDTIAKSIDTTGEADAILIFNTLNWERKDIASVKLPGDGDYAVLDGSGKEVASQTFGDQIKFVAVVPSMGYATYRLVKRAAKKTSGGPKASRRSLENKFYKVSLDPKGAISSLVVKSSGREAILPGRRGNLLQLFEDKSIDWQAWDIDFFYDDKWEDITQVDSIEVVESGPVFATLEIARSFSASRIKQRITIYAELPRIDFDSWADWHEENKCLKASFPIDVNASKARYEIQFGNTERPTHTNTSWDLARFEVCAHKWADISEEGFGFTLMNDCKYGHHTKGTDMRLTLLRAPKDPDPVADMGEHQFTYSIMPHDGDYIEAESVRRAYELNVPLIASVVKPASGSLPAAKSFISVDAPNVVLEAVKKAERSDKVILRFYECHNQRAKAAIRIDLPFKKVYETDLMEDNIAEIPVKNGEIVVEFKPFEIKTFKLV